MNCKDCPPERKKACLGPDINSGSLTGCSTFGAVEMEMYS